MIRFLLVAAVTVALLLFGLANLHVVELNTLYGGAVRGSLAFLLLGAFIGGFMVATIISLHQSFRHRKRARADREQVERQRVPEPRLPALPPPPQIPIPGYDRSWEPRLSRWR